MPAVENSPALVFDQAGRRLRCLACGRKLRHPAEGRSRVVCPSPSCELVRRRLRRQGLERWSPQDWAEAVSLWGGCAFCGAGEALGPSRHHAAPVPACPAHASLEGQELASERARVRIALWVERAKPGCPLPRAD